MPTAMNLGPGPNSQQLVVAGGHGQASSSSTLDPSSPHQGAGGGPAGVGRLLRVLRHNMLPIQCRSGNGAGSAGSNNNDAPHQGLQQQHHHQGVDDYLTKQHNAAVADLLKKPGHSQHQQIMNNAMSMSLFEPLPVQQGSQGGGSNVNLNVNVNVDPMSAAGLIGMLSKPSSGSELDNDGIGGCFNQQQPPQDQFSLLGHQQQQQSQHQAQQAQAAAMDDEQLFKALSANIFDANTPSTASSNHGSSSSSSAPAPSIGSMMNNGQQGINGAHQTFEQSFSFGGGGHGHGMMNTMNNSAAMNHANAVGNIMSNFCQQQGYSDNNASSMPPLGVPQDIVPNGVPSSTAPEVAGQTQQQQQSSLRFKPFHEEKWSQRLQELRKFRRENGNCLVPHTYPQNPQLARWVKRQRRQYKLLAEGKVSTMTPARVALLEDAGFVWDSHEASWREKIMDLRRYRARHGNTLVPSSYKANPGLAVWVKCQRRQYKLYGEGKPSAMSPERIQELESEGFCWEVRSPLPGQIQHQVGSGSGLGQSQQVPKGVDYARLLASMSA